MIVTPLAIPDVLLVTPTLHHDARGFFVETYSAVRYAAAGIAATFVQDNHSHSTQHTLRGLHYQAGPGQAKLVRVTRGHIWDVAVDIRSDSATFGRWVATTLDAEAHQQLFIPAGFAHGFIVLSERADVLYKVTTPYDAALERGLAWDDVDLAIDWPVAAPLLSARDRHNPSLATLRPTT